jgi:hypothetical protein
MNYLFLKVQRCIFYQLHTAYKNSINNCQRFSLKSCRGYLNLLVSFVYLRMGAVIISILSFYFIFNVVCISYFISLRSLPMIWVFHELRVIMKTMKRFQEKSLSYSTSSWSDNLYESCLSDTKILFSWYSWDYSC